MLIKKTQQKGFSIVGKVGEVILDEQKITIIRKEPADGQEAEYEITSLGEFDVADISVQSLAPYPLFVINVENFNVTYIPSPAEKFDDALISKLEQTDVLLVPGKHAELAQKIVPSYVIPLDEHAALAQSMGIELPEAESSLKLSRPSDLPEDSGIFNLG